VATYFPPERKRQENERRGQVGKVFYYENLHVHFEVRTCTRKQQNIKDFEMKKLQSCSSKRIESALGVVGIYTAKPAWLLPIFATIIISYSAGCKKENEPAPPSVPKSSEKAILSVKVPNCCYVDNTLVVDIDQNNRVVYIGMDSWQNIAAIEPQITVSPKATISPRSGIQQNFNNPVNYTVTAEDGSTVTYKIIVTQVSGGQAYQEASFSSGGSADNLHHDARFWSGDCCPDDFKGIHFSFGKGNNQFLLNLINKNLGDNLVGQYEITKPCLTGCSTAIFIFDNGTPKLLIHPYKGMITIAKYDRPNKLISGAYQNVRFKEQTEYPQFAFSGEFINVPLR